MEEIMVTMRTFAISLGLAVSSTVLVNSVAAESWAPISAGSDQWPDQQRSRTNLKRIRGLFDRLKAPEHERTSRGEDYQNSMANQEMEDHSPWTEQARLTSEETANQEPIPHYLESSRTSSNSKDFFVFGQDDPNSLLPSVTEYQAPKVAARNAVLGFEDPQINVQLEDPDVSGDVDNSDNYGFAPAPQSSTDNTMEYVVRPGDSLRQIARKIYQEPKRYIDIMQWNQLSTHNIYPGQKLILESVTPALKEQLEKSLEHEQRNLFPEQLYRYKVHKVGNGDSLARISKMYLGSQKHYAQLAKLNELDATKYLKVGQKIIVPIKKQN